MQAPLGGRGLPVDATGLTRRRGGPEDFEAGDGSIAEASRIAAAREAHEDLRLRHAKF